jgi:hypothetical protein
MKINTLWIVTYPSGVSELGDICFECDMRRLNLQFFGGLSHTEIHSVYTKKSEATKVAKELLKFQ